jgi:hypothetical protein
MQRQPSPRTNSVILETNSFLLTLIQILSQTGNGMSYHSVDLLSTLSNGEACYGQICSNRVNSQTCDMCFRILNYEVHSTQGTTGTIEGVHGVKMMSQTGWDIWGTSLPPPETLQKRLIHIVWLTSSEKKGNADYGREVRQHEQETGSRFWATRSTGPLLCSSSGTQLGL